MSMAVEGRMLPAEWPQEDIRQVIDKLGDGLLFTDRTRRVLYANPAAERLLGWPATTLAGTPFEVFLSPKYTEWKDRFESLLAGDSPDLMGKSLDVSLQRRDGSEVRVDLVLSVGTFVRDHQVAIAVLRPRDDQLIQRVSDFTQHLLDVLTTSSGESPADQLLAVLCRRLQWDVAALWGLESDGSLVCRGVWTNPDAPAESFVLEKLRHPDHDTGGLARRVMERGEPAWLTDISVSQRFTSEAIVADGLVSACALPI